MPIYFYFLLLDTVLLMPVIGSMIPKKVWSVHTDEPTLKRAVCKVLFTGRFQYDNVFQNIFQDHSRKADIILMWYVKKWKFWIMTNNIACYSISICGISIIGSGSSRISSNNLSNFCCCNCLGYSKKLQNAVHIIIIFQPFYCGHDGAHPLSSKSSYGLIICKLDYFLYLCFYFRLENR